MRVDQVIRDPRRTLQEVLRAFDSQLTARDNFAPEGVLGQVLTSNGPGSPPTYQDLPETAVGLTEEDVIALLGEHTHDGSDIVSGQVDPLYLGAGTRDGTRFLRDDGAWSAVAWGNLSGVPTDFAGYGLDDDLATALAAYYTAAQLDAGQLDTRYYTEAEVDALLAGIDYPVDSVFGRVGAVVAAAGDYDAFYYTEAEVDAMFAALLAGLDTHDLNDWPADAAGVLTNDGAGNYSWGAAGGGSVTGSGTAGKLSKWNTASDLTDSIVTESAALLTIVGGIQFSPDNTYDIGASAGGRPQSVWARSLFDLDDGTVRGVMSIQPSLFDIGTVSAHNFGFITNNALRAYFGATSGNFLWNNDNVNDIGAATSGRPRKIYAATSFDVGDAEYSETNIEFGSRSVAGPTYIDFHADGAATDYNTRLIRWNGTDGDFEIVQTGAGAGGRIRFFTQATARVHVSSSGNIQFDTDGANQIGLASSLRPSRICLTTDVMIGGNKIIGTRGASIPAPAATVASCQTAINTIISRMVAHGLIS